MIRRGSIILGIKEKTYDGSWIAKDGIITYTFAEPLPLLGIKVIRTYKRFSQLLPYELGGQMVNEIINSTSDAQV